MGTRVTRRAHITAGPADGLALLEDAGIMQTRFAQTEHGVCADLTPFGSFSGAQQVTRGTAIPRLEALFR
ncbi:MAG TPA: hypothetical protein DDY20_09645 [Desulfobulbaceae bacterium]|nr:hypothetical protein [Desulfobulbaceae bacterium]